MSSWANKRRKVRDYNIKTRADKARSGMGDEEHKTSAPIEGTSEGTRAPQAGSGRQEKQQTDSRSHGVADGAERPAAAEGGNVDMTSQQPPPHHRGTAENSNTAPDATIQPVGATQNTADIESGSFKMLIEMIQKQNEKFSQTLKADIVQAVQTQLQPIYQKQEAAEKQIEMVLQHVSQHREDMKTEIKKMTNEIKGEVKTIYTQFQERIQQKITKVQSKQHQIELKGEKLVQNFDKLAKEKDAMHHNIDQIVQNTKQMNNSIEQMATDNIQRQEIFEGRIDPKPAMDTMISTQDSEVNNNEDPQGIPRNIWQQTEEKPITQPRDVLCYVRRRRRGFARKTEAQKRKIWNIGEVRDVVLIKKTDETIQGTGSRTTLQTADPLTDSQVIQEERMTYLVWDRGKFRGPGREGLFMRDLTWGGENHHRHRRMMVTTTCTPRS